MKKLTLAIAFLAVTFAASAQNNRFYISLQGGPQLSFSETTGGYHTFNVNAVPTWQAGIYTGYTFRNQKMSIESGAQLARHDLMLDYPFRKIINGNNGPKIKIASTAWQVPLRFKYALLPIDKKIKLRSVLGAKLLIENMYTLDPKTNFENIYPNNNGYYRIEEEGGYANFKILNAGGINNILILETGLEMETKLTDKLNFVSSLIYQIGTEPYSYITHYHGSESSGFISNGIMNSSSRAEALALSFGLSYHFSIRE